MKRFQSSLERLLRIRRQAERLSELSVARMRVEVDHATSQHAVARHAIDGHVAELAARREQSSQPWVLTQSAHIVDAQRNVVAVAAQRVSEAQARLVSALSDYQSARRAREAVERTLESKQQAHRQACQNSSFADLIDWSMTRRKDRHHSIGATDA